MHFATCALCNMCTLQHVHFAACILFNRPSGQNSWMDQLDGKAGWTCLTDLLDGQVHFILSLGQIAYSKIDLLVCLLPQLLSPMKALTGLHILRLTMYWIGTLGQRLCYYFSTPSSRNFCFCLVITVKIFEVKSLFPFLK